MKKKGILIIIILLLFYVLLMYLMFGNKSNKNNYDNEDSNSKISSKHYKFLIVDNVSTWSYSNNEWKESKPSVVDNSNKYFKVYQNNDYLGEYKLSYAKNWNLFNEDNEFVNYNGNIFAYSNDFDIRLIRVNPKSLNDDNKDSITKEFKINNFDYLVSNQIVNVDLDNNGQMDEILCLSNIGLEDDNPNDFYNLFVIKLNDKYYKIIDENNNNSNTLDLSIYKFNRIFQFDNSFYIIVEKTVGIDTDSPKISNILYKFDKDNFIKLIND